MVPVKQVCPSQGSDDPIYTTNNPGYKYFSKPTDQTHPTHLKVATKEEVKGWMGVGGTSLGGYCAGVWPSLPYTRELTIGNLQENTVGAQ